MFSPDELRAEGFQGFVPLSTVGGTSVPKDGGVYVVLRVATSAPRFIFRSPVGHPDGRDLSVDAEMLADRWVDGCPVVYVGKATSLRKRLGQYRRSGSGGKSHRGGRYVWQLEDASELLVCWRVTPGQVPRDVEQQMLRRFANRHGCLPFANIDN